MRLPCLQAISAMQDGMRMLDDGSKVINTALSAMEQISSGIMTISTSVDDISGRAATLADQGHKVMEQIQTATKSTGDNQKTTATVQGSVGDTIKTLDRSMTSSSSLQTAVKICVNRQATNGRDSTSPVPLQEVRRT